MIPVDINSLAKLKLADGITARVVHAKSCSVAHVELSSGASVAEHAHPHEQVTTVMDGQLKLTVDGQAHVLTPGKAFTIPSGVPHAAQALSACYVIDVFCPVREDFRARAEGEAQE